MSTKAIREALSEYLMLADADPRGASPRERGVHAAALAEVEAIERAAKTVSDHGIYWGGCETGGVRDESPELDAAESVFDAIANQGH